VSVDWPVKFPEGDSVIVYRATKSQFIRDVNEHDIEDVVGHAYFGRTGKRVSPSEIGAWKESLTYMSKVLADTEIPDDSGIAIEYGIPGSAKRVDFLVTGLNESRDPSVVIVELKRWSKAKRTDKDAVVRTALGGSEHETTHPSYQAWSYAALLSSYNEAVYEGGMHLQPCAYLHNYAADGILDHPFYSHYVDKAPLFLKGDVERNKLRGFIKRYVRYGDKTDIVFQIENGVIRPSKSLVESLDKLMKGNQEFILIDDQKLVFETALSLAQAADTGKKQVMIIEGGPGTGKSVVAINLLVALTRLRKLARYVSKNAAPRSVYQSKLTGTMKKTVISNLFSGSGVFVDAEKATFDALIVDEAHRLNEKSGLYQNLGDNQIKELIDATKFSVFFIDEAQKVTLKDIGKKSDIEDWALRLGATVTHAQLSSQFRCNGSDGYLTWLDNSLDMAAHEVVDPVDIGFDCRVFDSPIELRDAIRKENRKANKARMVAGYCWDWKSKKDAQRFDVEIPEHNFQMRWNLTSDSSLWIIAPNSVEEIGCIHTCQGLEVDYIGVIIGPDLVVRNGEVRTVPEARSKMDKSISGYKKLKAVNSDDAKIKADSIIKNTYRTLMTRGMKGCYIYCTDLETSDYFKARLSSIKASVGKQPTHAVIAAPPTGYVTGELPFKRSNLRQITPFIDAVPIFDLRIAAGVFRAGATDDFFHPSGHDDWAKLPDEFRASRDLFVAQVAGQSMNRRIPDGAWCLFKLHPAGPRAGRVVLAQHRSISDPDTGGSHTVKVYQSKKVSSADGTWRHTEIRLVPDSTLSSYKPIVIPPKNATDFRILAELVAVL
jgi:uncharacterized protein